MTEPYPFPFLASERAAFVSGANYVLDGGSIPTV